MADSPEHGQTQEYTESSQVSEAPQTEEQMGSVRLDGLGALLKS